jgi:pachytene checkpoint protein 2
VHVYSALDEDEGGDDDEGEEGVPSYHETLLPAASLEGSWAALFFDTCDAAAAAACGW